jgi:hydrogenase maturation protease
VLILGIGNPIMGDDGVGVYVVRALKNRIGQTENLEFKELSVGGIGMVEEMLGYEKVFLVDSIMSENAEVGRIRKFDPEQFDETVQVSSPHVTNFATALQLYKRLEPARIPRMIKIFTIDISPNYTFGESISPTVQTAASKLVEMIVSEVKQ